MTVLILEGACLGAAAGMLPIGVQKDWSYRDVHEAAEHEAVKADSGEAEKVVALTFDDGPHEKYTALLLDGLKERGVKVTFFLMGENIEGKEKLVRRMQNEGHLIGNHSYRHIQLTKEGEGTVCEAVEQTEEVIEGITGERPRYLRPPYGDWNENLECQLDMTTVFWSVDSLDWKLKDVGKIVENVEKKVSSGDIVLMHDIFPTSVEAALMLVDRLREKGYEFVTVEELLID
ncbi:MAG: polysaccharide deacetylase family protein [Lachnospiraceae bacterium]|nr:polysaccharide deacetylase family protein [Lachnospiraceae bacterium]